jgi:hypothetical protein
MMRPRLVPFLFALGLLARAAFAQDLDQGIPELRALDPTLTGSGIAVTQVEAIASGTDLWEVDPYSLGQPVSKFTYISTSGSANTYPNDVGESSDHAHYVGENFYGAADPTPEGVAYGVSHIYNYEADFFANSIIGTNTTIPTEIVNQSYQFLTNGDTQQQAQIDQEFDNYADTYGTLFVNGAGDGGLVVSPASAYNCIAVGAYEGNTSSGNYDGRSKPDIVAYTTGVMGGDDTSFTSPVVAGAATLLLQAAQEGDAGSSRPSRPRPRMPGC